MSVEAKEAVGDTPNNDPFEQFLGAQISFSCVNAQGNIYLDGSFNDTVFTSSSTFGIRTGTHWKLARISTNNYQILNNAVKHFLDGQGTSVFLSTANPPDGTHWKASSTSIPNCYTIENLDNGDNKYLAYQNGKVVLSKTATNENGTHWRIGYVYLSQDQVASAVQKAFNQVTLSRVSSSPLRSMDLVTTTQIWTDNKIQNQAYSAAKFASDSFADLFQNSVNQFIYKDPSDWAAAFGGLYAVNSKGTRNAFNFFISAYLEFVMIDPVTNKVVATDGWVVSTIYV